MVESYGFGVQFKYHEKGHKNYVAAKYGNLREEILCNELYTISSFEYESIASKAQQYLSSHRGRTLEARKQSVLNRVYGVAVNAPISLQHVIALMLYTNMDELQRALKTGCKLLATDNGKVDAVKERNAEIASWCRLLLESIVFYGESMSERDSFYHGLSRKLLFRSVIAAFNCPTSTTSLKSVAYRFSTGSGIIVQLSRSNAFDYHYLDASYLSDYPHEEEQLFFQVLHFDSILEDVAFLVNV